VTDQPEGGKHIIRAVWFTHGTNDGPLDCSCGESMPASTFAQHRRDTQARKGTIESDLPMSHSVWRRSTTKQRPVRTRGVPR
jgi:hypothetical protein